MLYLLLKDEEVNTFLPWFPVKNMEETRAFYEKRLKNQEYYFAISTSISLSSNFLNISLSVSIRMCSIVVVLSISIVFHLIGSPLMSVFVDHRKRNTKKLMNDHELCLNGAGDENRTHVVSLEG